MAAKPLVGPDELTAYQQDGVVHLKGCFSETWIDLLNRGVDHNIANPSEYFAVHSPKAEQARSISDDWCWERIPEYQEFFQSSVAAEVAGRLMEAEEVRFLEDQYFEKDAGSTAPTPWHQDQPYYDIEGRWCTMWIPLDPVAVIDSLRFVRGSHRWSRLFHPQNFSAGGTGLYAPTDASAALEPMVEIDAAPDRYSVIEWAMQPGDCAVFHPCMIHGNRGNRSAHRARRMSLRFIAEDVIYVEGARPWPGLPIGHGLANREQVHGAKFPLVWTRSGGLVHGARQPIPITGDSRVRGDPHG
jgi:ectoine hydroxylase-related dioxygenase (phytanoyl-CoA dioxygenase family)